MSTPTQLRRDVANLSRLAERDLAALWATVATAAQARQALNDILPALVETYGMAAGAIAADWYDEARAKAGVGRAFYAEPIPVPPAGAPKLTTWALGVSTDLDNAKSLVAGGVQRRLANVARGTVMRSSSRDPLAVGWMRVGAGACGFCRMLIARGAVYTEETVDFGAHDHCNCQAAPKWPGAEPIDVQEYRESTRRRSDSTREADNDRARAWIDEHLADAPTAPRLP